jgi:hypothetical protein
MSTIWRTGPDTPAGKPSSVFVLEGGKDAAKIERTTARKFELTP